MEYQRHTRSFVRRESRMTPRQQKALGNCSNQYLIDIHHPPDLKNLFPEGAVTLEIGFGMGASLAEMARLHPGMNFIGVEVHQPGVGALLATLQEQHISNVRLINTDVIHVLRDIIPTAFLDRVLIFFPDPWPKKRHHKRRLIQSAFIELLKPTLKSGALLHIATDWADYAEHIRSVMAAMSEFLPLPPEVDLRLETKFERRGLKLGHDIVDLLYRFS